MTRPPVRVRSRERSVGLDRHWLRSTGFTLLLVGLVAAAIGADWTATLSSLVTCAVGFGFFYLLFPGGAHFGMTVANFLAIYACMFEFFRDANFPAASREARAGRGGVAGAGLPRRLHRAAPAGVLDHPRTPHPRARASAARDRLAARRAGRRRRVVRAAAPRTRSRWRRGMRCWRRWRWSRCSSSPRCATWSW